MRRLSSIVLLLAIAACRPGKVSASRMLHVVSSRIVGWLEAHRD